MTKLNDIAKLPPISVGVINYNGINIIESTLNSIFASDYPEIEVVMVDDCSSDGSVEFVREKFPQVRVFQNPTNMGLNAGRNRAMQEIRHDIVFMTDNDIELEQGTLRLLAETMLTDETIGQVTPMVLDSEKRNQIYSNGAQLHYACFGIIPQRHKPIDDSIDWKPRKMVVGSGGMMLIRKSVNEILGGFDEDFNHGYTEGEYSVRMTAAGYKVMQVPRAKIYHLENSVRNPKKLRYQIRSRWDLILKVYSVKSLILLGPALFFFEIANFSFLVTKGGAGEWFRGMWMILSNFKAIMKKRKVMQAMKKQADKDLLTSGEIYMFPHRLGRGKLAQIKKLFESALNGYWRLVRSALTS